MQNGFSIRLLTGSDLGSDGRCLGEIRIGSFVERFAVFPFDGDEKTVAARWIEELRSLIGGAAAVGLPTASNMTWVLYRVGAHVFIRQMLMVKGRLGPTLKRGKVIDLPAYKPNTDDAERVSEWETSMGAISAFVSAS